MSLLVTNEDSNVGERLTEETVERLGLWVAAPFTATVRDVDASGDRFEAAAVLQALRTCGLDMRLSRPVVVQSRLFAIVRLSTAADLGTPALRVAVCGRVVGLLQQPDRWYQVALAFKHYRLLYI